jgi:hypothetical protein
MVMAKVHATSGPVGDDAEELPADDRASSANAAPHRMIDVFTSDHSSTCDGTAKTHTEGCSA